MVQAKVQWISQKWAGLASNTECFSAHFSWAREQVLKQTVPTEQSITGYDLGVTLKALTAKLGLLACI